MVGIQWRDHATQRGTKQPTELGRDKRERIRKIIRETIRKKDRFGKRQKRYNHNKRKLREFEII